MVFQAGQSKVSLNTGTNGGKRPLSLAIGRLHDCFGDSLGVLSADDDERILGAHAVLAEHYRTFVVEINRDARTVGNHNSLISHPIEIISRLRKAKRLLSVVGHDKFPISKR